ncbi:MAG: DUF1624 domain-containing protein [Chitinophagaceae bacterium]|nr:DUF1624 domain-containing protein [Chitinophagaceae bacterium]
MPNTGRFQSIDTLRGFVMVLMALDHVRDYFHVDAFRFEPTDLSQTNPALFFTRWITHYCAPVFVLLAGTSAYLVGLKRGRKALSSFLLTRGLWLIVVEVVIVSFGWTFDPFFDAVVLQVIWAIGISMVVLSLLVHLPFTLILTLGCVIVLGHNLLDYPEAELKGNAGLWWDLLHHGQFTPYLIIPGHVLLVAYAFLPWTGIIILGYCMGKWFAPNTNAALRKKRLVTTGLLLIGLFILLRVINQYGDPLPWKPQGSAMFTLMSFLNISKYPPSLMYTCVTIGPALLVLAALQNTTSRVTSVLNIYGRVPFFYYLLHLYLIHVLCMIAFFVAGYTAADIPSRPFFFRPNSFGYPLWAVYIVWLLAIALLYPVCRWYDRYKSSHRKWWLSYV